MLPTRASGFVYDQGAAPSSKRVIAFRKPRGQLCSVMGRVAVHRREAKNEKEELLYFVSPAGPAVGFTPVLPFYRLDRLCETCVRLLRDLDLEGDL